MPEIRQTTGGTLVRVVIGYSNTGRPIRKSKTFPKGTRKATMEKWVKEILDTPITRSKVGYYDPDKHKINDDDLVLHSRILKGNFSKPFDDVIDDFLAYKKNDLAPRTIKEYTNECRLYLRGKLPKIGKITRDDIQKLLDNYNNLSPRSQKKIQMMVSMIFNFAVDREYIDKNPVKRTKVAKQRRNKNIQVFSVDQYQKALEVCEDLGVLTLLYTGLRISELLALQIGHVDLSQNTIKVDCALDGLSNPRQVGEPKSHHAYRTLKVPQTLIDLLAVRLAEMDDELFIFPLGRRAYQNRLNKLCVAVGSPRLTIHDLRHSHCTYLLAQQASPIAVKERLGHHSVGFMLDTYGHMIPSMDDKLMEALG